MPDSPRLYKEIHTHPGNPGFLASLKKEHIDHVRLRTRDEAKAAVFDYIEVF
jgi:hypothetical protein